MNPIMPSPGSAQYDPSTRTPRPQPPADRISAAVAGLEQTLENLSMVLQPVLRGAGPEQPLGPVVPGGGYASAIAAPSSPLADMMTGWASRLELMSLKVDALARRFDL